MNSRKKIKLNMRFSKGKVICAKSPELCKECKQECEKMELYYYPFNKNDIRECFKNNERKT